MTARSPNLYETIKAGIDAALDDLHTAMPGIVRSYDPATQLASVQPAIQRRFLKPDGTEDKRNFPVIENVPVCFPRAGDFFLSFPIAVGDFVLLIFAERSLDQWLDKGDIQDPIVTTSFDLSDAMAIPGVYPKPDKLPATDTGFIVLGKAGQPTKEAARKGDAIQLPIGATLTGTATGVVPGSISITLTAPTSGSVTGGSANVKVSD